MPYRRSAMWRGRTQRLDFCADAIFGRHVLVQLDRIVTVKLVNHGFPGIPMWSVDVENRRRWWKRLIAGVSEEQARYVAAFVKAWTQAAEFDAVDDVIEQALAVSDLDLDQATGQRA